MLKNSLVPIVCKIKTHKKKTTIACFIKTFLIFFKQLFLAIVYKASTHFDIFFCTGISYFIIFLINFITNCEGLCLYYKRR